MNNCRNCKHFDSYLDGETEPQFGEMVYTDLQQVDECKLDRKEFATVKPVECPKFKNTSRAGASR